MIHVVTTTRLSKHRFMMDTLLGKSLPRLEEFESGRLSLYADNRRSPGHCYNEVIDKAPEEEVLVFIHDDVFIEDWTLPSRLDDALKKFDLVGVAGNRRLQPGQQAWHLQPGSISRQSAPLRDDGHLSGAIAQGNNALHSRLCVFGPAPQEVAVLDGVFLATRAKTLRDADLRFDPSLGFHFYDLDFCRRATAAGLRLGTWPIALTRPSHENVMYSDAWSDSLRKYQQKWGET